MTDWLISFWPSLGGGLLIGAATGGLYLFSGRIAGISGILGGAILLQQGWWRWAFVAGLIGAGALAHALGHDAPNALTSTGPLVLIASGVVTGFGAYLGAGCTSGHGVCGLARLSPRSLVAVVVFMSTAAATVFVTRHLGVVP